MHRMRRENGREGNWMTGIEYQLVIIAAELGVIIGLLATSVFRRR